VLLAFLGLVGMQAVYWILTHPVNRFWLRGQTLGASGSSFFSIASAGRAQGEPGSEDWKRLRNRWEYSHVIRAGLALVSFISLATAMLKNLRT
jgi:hypothetical protein